MSFLKNIVKKIPAVRRHIASVNALVAEVLDLQKRLFEMTSDRERLLAQINALREQYGSHDKLQEEEDWSKLKELKQRKHDEEVALAPFSQGSARIHPLHDQNSKTVAEWLCQLVNAEPYWFQRIEITEGLFSPGWSDPVTEKLPHYGLPADLSGMRVLDIGCAEGFFSFEAERQARAKSLALIHFPIQSGASISFAPLGNLTPSHS